MEPLLKKRSVQLSQRIMDKSEECAISGEYILPEYCPDIAVILKCFAYPHVQNRQWSGDQLLIDGAADMRVLYLDEDRQCVRSLEFVQPFSCAVRGNGNMDVTAVELHLVTKYLTCRAVSPRRVEFRGAITISAVAECAVLADMAEPLEVNGFFARTQKVPITIPGTICEKVMSVTESLEFDRSLPPAEMLLGGECRAVVKEYKILAGKVIIKGMVYIHQLYTDSLEGMDTYSLDYSVPFSQIMDVPDAREDLACKSSVQVLSDAERCSVGPDGENTMLDIVIKLLIQVQVYQPYEVMLLQDAFHSRYPVSAKTEEMYLSSFVGQHCEETKLTLETAMPSGQWREVVDAWVQWQDAQDECSDGKLIRKGRVLIVCIARDADGEIACHESMEEYRLAFPVQGNDASVNLHATEVRCKIHEGKLEVQVALIVSITEWKRMHCCAISDLSLVEEAPYPKSKANALLYYAHGGESLWDIGRLCHTAPQGIAQENNLSGEFVDDACVLIVPVTQ